VSSWGSSSSRGARSGGQWLAASLECFNALDAAEPTGAGYSQDRGVVINTQSPIILPSIGIEGGL
jgi:hypothetical protein